MGNKKAVKLRRPAKRKFGGNRYTRAVDRVQDAVADTSAAPTSASKRKLDVDIPAWILGDVNSCSSSLSESSSDETSNPDISESDDFSSCDEKSDSESSQEATDDPASSSGTRLLDFSCLQAILDTACTCKQCGCGKLVVYETQRYGLASSVSVVCQNCDVQTSFSLVEKTGRFYDCNRRSILAARMLGSGHAGLQKFCGIMNLPPPVRLSAFQSHQRALCHAAQTVASKSMCEAAAEVRALNLSRGEPENATAVTFDGTWMKRGYSSLYGVFTAIDWHVGRVVDIHVSSKYCQTCSIWKCKREYNQVSVEEYAEWKEAHADKCPINTTRSSPGMEAEAAVTLWKRSSEERALEYRTYIGDGDSKGFNAVVDAKPYGGDVTIVKEECVGHIQKRVGSNLRELKKEWRGKKLNDGQGIGGRGRLTDEMIDRLQFYYGHAVRQNSNNLQAMARAIWAGLCHRASTGDKPMHQFCPPGPESWCGWQRAEAGTQDKYEHHDSLPKAVFEVVKPIYIRLTDKNLLLRCLRGATQNQNESFNGLIWELCPKTTFCGASVVKLSANLAVAHFNHGAVTLLQVLTEMGCRPGYFTKQHLQLEDAGRVRKANRKASRQEKQRRKVRRRRRKGIEEQKLDDEGCTYAAGAF